MLSAINPAFQYPLCPNNFPKFFRALPFYGYLSMDRPNKVLLTFACFWAHTNIILHTVFFDLVFPLTIISKMHQCSFSCSAVYYPIAWIYHKWYLHPPPDIHLCFSSFVFFCFVFSLGTKLLWSMNVSKSFSRTYN